MRRPATYIFLVICAVFLVAMCNKTPAQPGGTTAPSEEIVAEFHNDGPMELTIVVMNTDEELNEICGYDAPVWGCSDWGKLWCQMWVLEPHYVDDLYVLTIGHELLHCMRGFYHIEDEY